MEVREPSGRYLTDAGTQLTEIGALPKDWSVVPLTTLVEKIMVGIASAATHAYRSTGVTMFRNQNIRPGLLETQDVLYIDPHYEQTYKNKRLKAGDLLTARTGYPGTTSLVPAGFDGAQSFTTLITRPRPSSIDPQYLCLYINGRACQRYFEQTQIGGGQKNVNAASLKLLPVALPSTDTEQRAIARALTDADALIDSLEQLLTKKRQIKQGAMQELLTGKRRLPGFTANWATKRIGDLLAIRHGRSQKTVECVGGDFPILATGGQIGWASAYLHVGPSVLIGRKGTIDQPRYMDSPFWSVDTLFYSDVFHPNVAKFLYYRFCLIDWMRHNEASGVPSLGAKVIESIEIACPDATEQEAIAKALTDIDADVAALESRLTKARALKQAMAQALLTGRIRLVEPTP
jgi:type I restriction enzyme S subunit